MTVVLLALLAQSSVVQLPDVRPADVVGTWEGSLEAGAVKLRLALHFKEVDGKLTAALDSLDQGARGIPSNLAFTQGRSVIAEFKQLQARFDAKLESGKLVGHWEQGGAAMPLTLSKASPPKRPQTPRPPFPYKEEEVRIPSAGGVTLAGTLTIPGQTPAPAIVLISGSGPQDRDETILDHKPFAVIADRLARQGIATLRFDDRGTGKSTGSYANSTIHDFAADARATMAFARSHKAVDTSHVGVLGHSEGGLVAMMIAEETKPSFLVLLAAPGEPLDQILMRQAETITRATGASEELLRANREAQTVLYSLLKSDLTPEELNLKVRTEATRLGSKIGIPAAAIEQQIKTMTSPSFIAMIKLDPLTYARRIAAPTLIVNGDKDKQVDAEANARPLGATIKGSNVHILPGLNHLLQPATTGLPSEYGAIETTMDDSALRLITDWVVARTRR